MQSLKREQERAVIDGRRLERLTDRQQQLMTRAAEAFESRKQKLDGMEGAPFCFLKCAGSLLNLSCAAKLRAMKDRVTEQFRQDPRAAGQILAQIEESRERNWASMAAEQERAVAMKQVCILLFCCVLFYILSLADKQCRLRY